MNLKKIIVICAIAVLATTSFAQGRGGFMRMMGGGNPALLLGRPDVQNDLQLTDEQKTKLDEVRQNFMQGMRDARQNVGQDQDAMRKAMEDLGKKNTEEVNKILTPDQQKRLKEINVQLSGPLALVDNKELQDQIGLSDAQKTQVGDLVTQQRAANQAIMEKVRNQELTFQDAAPSFQKNQQALKDGIDKVLNDDQKAKLKAAGGTKPFVSTEDNGGGGLLEFLLSTVR